MNPKAKSEISVGKPVIEFLEAEGWDVYQEVRPQDWTGIADIIAVRGETIWIIEVKTSLGLAVIAQAYRWRRHAHLISVAVPTGRETDARGLGLRVLAWLGIGCLEVSKFGGVHESVEPIQGQPFVSYAEKVIGALLEGHKAYAEAGSTDGKRWSKFKLTCRKLADIVAAHPGIAFKDAVRKLDSHHYGSEESAMAALRHWIKKGKVPGVKAEWIGTKLHLQPAEKEPASSRRRRQ